MARLIDADALGIGKEKREAFDNPVYADGWNSAIDIIENAPTVDAIPIEVMKRKISGICAADQCDQAGRYDYELRNALKTVLEWYNSPNYKECKDGRRE